MLQKRPLNPNSRHSNPLCGTAELTRESTWRTHLCDARPPGRGGRTPNPAFRHPGAVFGLLCGVVLCLIHRVVYESCAGRRNTDPSAPPRLLSLGHCCQPIDADWPLVTGGIVDRLLISNAGSHPGETRERRHVRCSALPIRSWPRCPAGETTGSGGETSTHTPPGGCTRPRPGEDRMGRPKHIAGFGGVSPVSHRGGGGTRRAGRVLRGSRRPHTTPGKRAGQTRP